MRTVIVACDKCNGAGVVEREEGGEPIECRLCEGTGKLAVEDNDEDAAYDRSQAERDLP